MVMLAMASLWSCKKDDAAIPEVKDPPIVTLTNEIIVTTLGTEFYLEADLAVAGKHLGNYLLDSVVVLPAGGDFYLPIQLEVKNASLLTNSLSVLLGDSIPYTVIGKVRGGRKNLMTEMPFSYSGHLTSNDFHF